MPKTPSIKKHGSAHHTSIANHRLLPDTQTLALVRLLQSTPQPPRINRNVKYPSDARRFTFDKFAATAPLTRTPKRPAPDRYGKAIRDQLRYTYPDQTAVCLRRKQRREVLHALRRTRKGAGGKKRRSYRSNIHC